MRFRAGLVSLCLVGMALCPGVGTAEPQYRVVVNGKEINSDVPPTNINGRLLVPVRAVAEALDAQVSYEPSTFTAFIDTVESPQSTTFDDEKQELLSLSELRTLVAVNLVLISSTYSRMLGDAKVWGLTGQSWNIRAGWAKDKQTIADLKAGLAKMPSLLQESAWTKAFITSNQDLKPYGLTTHDGVVQTIDEVFKQLDTYIAYSLKSDADNAMTALVTAEAYNNRLVYASTIYQLAADDRMSVIIGNLGK